MFLLPRLSCRRFSTNQALTVEKIPVEGMPRLERLIPVVKIKSENEEIVRKEYTNGYFDAPVINFEKQIVSKVELDPKVFGERVRIDIIHRSLIHRLKQYENARGIVPTKRVVDVHGSTRKRYKQKGRGEARHATPRAPQFRGGGKSHGRKVRDLRLHTPSKVLKMGFRSALAAKYAHGQIIIIDKIVYDKFSTMKLRLELEKKGWPVGQMLFLDYPEIDAKFYSSSRRVKDLLVMKAHTCNIWDILRREYIVLTPAALAEITRIYKP